MQSINEIKSSVQDYLAENETLADFSFDYLGDDCKELVTFSNDGYSRNILVKEKRFDIVLVGWNPGQRAPTHTHPERGCAVKVLQGTLVEKKVCSKGTELAITILSAGETLYIHDSLCYHSFCNDSDDPAVTLHVYAPSGYTAEMPIYN